MTKPLWNCVPRYNNVKATPEMTRILVSNKKVNKYIRSRTVDLNGKQCEERTLMNFTSHESAKF
jgi:hypothetical protein